MNQTTTPCAHGEPDAATSRKSGSVGGGEETTGRKAGTGASPPTQRPGDAAEAAALVLATQEFVANSRGRLVGAGVLHAGGEPAAVAVRVGAAGGVPHQQSCPAVVDFRNAGRDRQSGSADETLGPRPSGSAPGSWRWLFELT